MKLPFLGKAGGKTELLKEADLIATKYEAKRTELEAEKSKKLQRQVELWSVLTPSSELEKEYKEVSAYITELIRQSLALDEYVKKLRLAHYHCRQGACDRLESLMQIKDPTAVPLEEILAAYTSAQAS